jgi:hypothetical protein
MTSIHFPHSFTTDRSSRFSASSIDQDPVLANGTDSTADFIADVPPLAPSLTNRWSFVGFITWVIFGTFSAGEWLFGLASMMMGLAILAAIPILQFLTLGYMLETAGRMVRTGKFSSGFIGIRFAARAGGIVACSWLMLLPLRYLSDVAFTASIIDPEGRRAASLRLLVLVLTYLLGFHLVMAIARGGKIRYFLWPFNFVWVIKQIYRGNAYARARDATWERLVSLRLPYYFWLGLRGFAGTLFWLIFPVTLLALGHAPTPIAPIFGVIGAIWLGVMVLYLPILQTRFAAENRFRALFEWREARLVYGRAPWAISFALMLSLLFAIPLYLFKIEVLPAEALWLPSLFFILFIFPARYLMGFAISLAYKRPQKRHWFFRWTGRLPLLPAALFYVLFVFLSQYTSWNGIVSMYEQHAFLVPVPFSGN